MTKTDNGPSLTFSNLIDNDHVVVHFWLKYHFDLDTFEDNILALKSALQPEL